MTPSLPIQPQVFFRPRIVVDSPGPLEIQVVGLTERRYGWSGDHALGVGGLEWGGACILGVSPCH